MTTPSPGTGASLVRLRRIAERLRRRQLTATSTPPANTSAVAGNAPPPASGSSPNSATGANGDRWWPRMERSMSLLVSLSTLAAAGFTWMTIRQAGSEQQIARDGQVTDRYTAAVANLGDTSEEVRIGGMYALQRIAQDSRRDAPTVVQVLAAYVRSHSPDARPGTVGTGQPANDVQAALTILATPLAKYTPVDLHGADLHGAVLPDAHLGGANLDGTNLTNANLRGANLDRSILTGTNLGSADLHGANLHGAVLGTSRKTTFADMQRYGVAFFSTDLTQAVLINANLTGTDLSRANLGGAILTGAKGYEPSSSKTPQPSPSSAD
ncbi:pentapeptide repeat-containing protein [Streptomyces sp. NPDC004100]